VLLRASLCFLKLSQAFSSFVTCEWLLSLHGWLCSIAGGIAHLQVALWICRWLHNHRVIFQLSTYVSGFAHLQVALRTSWWLWALAGGYANLQVVPQPLGWLQA